MSFVDYLKGIKAEDLALEVAFGTHAIAGDLTKATVSGDVVTIQHLLGDAFGKGWKGPRGLWFSGTLRDSSKYKFYPGIMSPSNTDTVQGQDSVFDKDTPHSNTAWIRVECPSGSEVGIPDADIVNTPPVGLKGIYDCQLGDIYDEDGDVVDTAQLLVNPADVIAFGCKEIRRFDNSRIDWGSLAELRSTSDLLVLPDYTTLPQGVGLTGRYYDGSAFNTFKSKRIDPVIEYDTSTGAPALDISPTGFSVRWEGKIRFKYSETYTMTLIHNDSGKLWINDLTTALIDQASAGTHTATFAATAGVWYDVKIEWTNASGDSQFQFLWQSTSQPYKTVAQEQLIPKAEGQPRFRTNARFTTRTTFDAFLRAVLFTCNGGYQDVNGKLRFFCVDDLDSSFAFTEANVLKNTLKYSARFTQQELLEVPNRFIADGRDLESRYLEPFNPPLVYDLPELQALAGRVIEETVSVGNVTRWQALSNLAFYAKLATAPLVADFEGMPVTMPVLPYDLVTMTHSMPSWSEKLFITAEATDKSTKTNADERIFKLLEWSPAPALVLADGGGGDPGGGGGTPTVATISGLTTGGGGSVTVGITEHGGTGTIHVWRKLGSGGTYSEIGTAAHGDTAYADTVGSSGTYYYKLTQDGITGESAEQSVVVTITSSSVASISSVSESGGVITVNITSNGGTGNVHLWAKLGSGGTYADVGNVAAGVTSITYTPGASGTYFLKLSQVGETGYSSETSISISAPPSDLEMTVDDSGSPEYDVTLSWTRNGATGDDFVQERIATGGWSTVATIPTSDDASLLLFRFHSGTTKFYQWRVGNTGSSGYSNIEGTFI